MCEIRLHCESEKASLQLRVEILRCGAQTFSYFAGDFGADGCRNGLAITTLMRTVEGGGC